MSTREGLDSHWIGRLAEAGPLPRDAGKRRSIYLTMRDGTNVALDVTLPSSFKNGDRLPTMLRQTRYFRSVELSRGLDFRASRDAFEIAAPTRERFLARGYAWVDVDVRGSGVSNGCWQGPWSRAEVADGAEVVDFIVGQGWSNGLVGSTGISYEGTTAEMLLVNGHPAVRAIAPRFSLLCAYEDIAFPGGCHLSWFTEGWARYNQLLDAHREDAAFAELVYVIAQGRTTEPGARWAPAARSLLERVGPQRSKALLGALFGTVLRGARRVDADVDGALRARALRDHEGNGDVHQLCLEGPCRDDTTPQFVDLGFAVVSPRGNLPAIEASGAAVYGQGGWLDGAYPQSATRRFASLASSKLLLGPWSHAGFLAHEPDSKATPTRFAHDAELLRFFDLHLKGIDDGIGDEPRVRYFTLGENRWRSADRWPPAACQQRELFLSSARALQDQPEGGPASPVVVRQDASFGTGPRSRWRGLLAGFVPADYPDFGERTRSQVSFDSAPLAHGLVVTGHPLLRLQTRGAPDFLLMAYLVDVHPDGSVRYVTEGQLRAWHRRVTPPEPGFSPLTPHHSFLRGDAAQMPPDACSELSIGLLPTSYAFRARHRVRLIITLGDRDHFAPLTGAANEIAIMTAGDRGSSLVLTVEP